MKQKYSFNSKLLGDAVQLTLQQEESSLKVYSWMLDAGLRSRTLLTYACIFDILRKEPHKPKYINLANIARRIRTNRNNVAIAANILVENNMLYRRSVNKAENYYSLYPIKEEDNGRV